MKYKKKSTATIDYIQTASERKVNSDILTTEVAGIDISENGIEYISTATIITTVLALICL